MPSENRDDNIPETNEDRRIGDDGAPDFCLRCHGEMVVGWVPDMLNSSPQPELWYPGPFTRTRLGLARFVRGVKPLVVTTYRCVRCGYLESYARSTEEEIRAKRRAVDPDR